MYKQAIAAEMFCAECWIGPVSKLVWWRRTYQTTGFHAVYANVFDANVFGAVVPRHLNVEKNHDLNTKQNRWIFLTPINIYIMNARLLQK